MNSQPPSDRVLSAFGAADGVVVPLSGGQGTSWRAGSVVFKPADQSVPELEWMADLFSQVQCDGFRMARQLRAHRGEVSVDGWCATDYVAGSHVSRRWADVIAVGEIFHAALGGIVRPAFLDERVNPWAIGDRVAWGDVPASAFTEVPHVGRLAAAARPVKEPSQLIHGDLGGNVLFDDVLPPAIIDFSPYWRPVSFASAVVVADALVWEGADLVILGAVRHVDDFGQYLLRALIYRLVTEWILGSVSRSRGDRCRTHYAAAVDLACELAVTG